MEKSIVLEDHETLYTIQTKDKKDMAVYLQASLSYINLSDLLYQLSRWARKGYADEEFKRVLERSIKEHEDACYEKPTTFATVSEDGDGDLVLNNVSGSVLADALGTYLREKLEYKDLED